MVYRNIESDNQIVYSGQHSLGVLRSVVEENQYKRVLIISGRKSWYSMRLEPALRTILDDVVSSRFYEFSPNPKVEDAVNAAAARVSFDPDAIIAIGGGSVLDMAKLCIALPWERDAACRVVSGEQEVNIASVPIIAVPTTAGSGSEATHFAVVYIDGKKYSLASPLMLPGTVILDPVLTRSLSRSLAVVSAWDAFSQSIESLWARNATDSSRRYARYAISIIKDVLPALYDDPAESDREKMLEAAHFAGKAINISKTTAPHALSYAFTSRYGLSHGHAVALNLCPVFRHHIETLEQSTGTSADLSALSAAMTDIMRALDCSDLWDAARVLNGLLERSELSLDLKKLGVSSETELLSLLDDVNRERLQNHPIELGSDELAALYSRMWNNPGDVV